MTTLQGTNNDDLLVLGLELDGLNDVVLGLAGDDEIDAELGEGGNILGGGDGQDALFAGENDKLLGDNGDDELDAESARGNNILWGGKGNDTLFAGRDDRLLGGAGNDTLYGGAGNNILRGGSGGDRLWIAVTNVPDAPNTIQDFNSQVDQIGVLLAGVDSLEDLLFVQVGSNTEIKLANGGQVLAVVENSQSTDFNTTNVILDPNVPLNSTPAVVEPQSQSRIVVKAVEFLGLTTFATGTTFAETQVGGLSGLTYDSDLNLYYAISDDRSSINPARFYTLAIDLSDGILQDGDVTFTQVTTLLDSNGAPFATNTVDFEGIALTENGSVYITSEGDANALINPSVNEFSLSGQQIEQLNVPSKFLPTADKSTGIRQNLAFESTTLSPDGRYLYTATESALNQDGTIATLTDSSLARIIKYDLATGLVVGEFVYEVEPIPQGSEPAGGFADNGLVELIALDNNGTLLALERSFASGVGNTVKLYEVLTQGALNVKDFESLYREEPLEEDGEIIPPGRYNIDPTVQKRLLVDFADLGIAPDNLEGISLGPVLEDGRQSLIVVSDNNFNAAQTTQVIALALELTTLPAALPTVETPYTIDDEAGTTPLIGDSDDPAVWIDPTNAENSLVMGTLKDGGLAVFSLDGEILQTIKPADVLGAGAEYGDLRYNNVDVLYNFSLGNDIVDIAVVSDRQNDTLNIFKIDPSTRQLVNITSDELLNGDFSIFGVDDGEATAYGLAGYRSPITGQYYVFATQASGNRIAQLELKATEGGTITGKLVRTVELPIEEGKEAGDYQSEAIAVDQEQGVVYLAVEGEIGIVKFAAEPNGGDTITVVRPVDSPELVPDLEGLAIYYGPNGTGYLVASSQGDSTYAVYRREGDNEYLGSFVVGDNTTAGIDQANETDGLDIINVPLGAGFPLGALLVQDGANEPQNVVENGDELENNATNFKFVPWEAVANAFETPLLIDNESYDPRAELAPIRLQLAGSYANGQFDAAAAEIPAYDAKSKRVFVVNAEKGQVDVLDVSNPVLPTLITSIDVSGLGFPNSISVKNGLVAIALENENKQANGQVLFYRADSSTFGAPLKAVEVGALPDMVVFAADGNTVLVANEGEPNSDYTVDPVGSVSIIDLSRGLDNAIVKTADFTAFNDQIDQLRASGVKLKGDVGTGRTVAQDLEPEYISFSPDGTQAWVTLQEANAVALIDLATATVESIKPLGFKDYSGVRSSELETFTINNLPSIGTTEAGQELFLGGFSGLYYEGQASNGNLKFITHTDRGPNGEPTGSNRPFLLPDFNPEIVRLELDRQSGAVSITERIKLQQADGTPMTGLPNLNIPGATGNTPYNDEIPVDLQGNIITPLDTLGADLEGIVVAGDGSFWMVDEYRPAIYHFDRAGKLLDRFVPVGTAAAAGEAPNSFGTEVLPAVLAQRRQNRGFEAVALDQERGKLYAFVQSPLRNPSTVSNAELNNLHNIRIVEFDVATETVTGEYLYRLDNANLGTAGNTRPDKIGDAVYLGNGEFLVVERDDDALDSDPLSNIEKKVYRFNLTEATNILGQDAPLDLGGGVSKTIDQMTPGELASQGINLVDKTLHVDLALAGYNKVEKVEGLALVDANTIAVINDNDFQVAGITLNGDGTFTPDPNPEPVVLGLITTEPNQLDASDRDGAINIQSWPVFGLFQPDAVAAYEFNGQTYYVTANEGDVRDYEGYGEAQRIKDVTLDPTAFPNAPELQADANLGRLQITTELGDTDGDGDFDALYTFGGRSFSIWSSEGQLVYDGGADFEQMTATFFPDYFNASNSNNTFDNRSDDKGPEPEGLVLGEIGDRTYAFIGLERVGGVMVYDVTNPSAPQFVQYLNNRDFSAEVETPAAGDLGPEGLTFISAQNSPQGKPLLVVGNEVSGTTTVYEIAVPSIPNYGNWEINAGDRNGDGILDVEQDNVASILKYEGDPNNVGDFFTLVAPQGFTFSGVRVIENTVFGNENSFEDGFLDFTLEGLNPGESVTIDVLLPQNTPANTFWQTSPQSLGGIPFAFDGTQGSRFFDLNGDGVTDLLQLTVTGEGLGAGEVGAPSFNDTPLTLVDGEDSGIFQVGGATGVAGTLSLQLKEAKAFFTNQLGVFRLDAENRINGLAPDQAGFVEAALAQSTVLLSTLPEGGNVLSRPVVNSFTVTSGDRLGFYLVANGTAAGVLEGGQQEVYFSLPELNPQGQAYLQTTATEGGFRLAWEDADDFDFNDLVVDTQIVDQPLSLQNLVGNVAIQDQDEILDFRILTGKEITGTFTVNREAAFDSFVGFYRIDDVAGKIDELLPGDSGYQQAALERLVTGLELSADNLSTSTFTGVFEGGSLYAPLLAVGSNLPTLGINTPVYVPFVLGNKDQSDHVKLLGLNTFGFEDLPGGGDQDFNDLTVAANFNLTL